MKTKNFPARKKARQMAAKLGISVYQLSLMDMPEIHAARNIRTKKNRSGQ